MKLYGPKTCATVKKVKKFLDNNNICYEFIDLTKESISKDKIEYWNSFSPSSSLLNNRSKKYRDLKLKGKKLTEEKITSLLSEENLLLKRPIIEHGLNGEKKLTVGFDEDEYKATFLS